MHMPPSSVPATLDSALVRQAGPELLSLALMDARNFTLQVLGAFEQAQGAAGGRVLQHALVLAGRAGWVAERWIARNPRRASGPACPADAVRLASIEPNADTWFAPWSAPQPTLEPPTPGTVRSYLLAALETTLDLLEKAPGDDAALHFFRMALFVEDACGEALVALAQAHDVHLPLQLPPAMQPREPIALPATRWTLGWRERGFALDIERGSETVDVPDFEIDAQPTAWADYVEFIDDGGYDRAELWHPDGWRWLQQAAAEEGRRGPGHVEQIGTASGAVLQTFFGKAMRMGAQQAAMHVTWWEADAFARWRGRRLPTEAEWEIAAEVASRRGFRWGDVREWTAGTVRPWEGWQAEGWTVDAGLDAAPVFGKARVQRGASFATRARMRHPRARRWALPGDDSAFVGFRTCI
jgi:formylglycine-generating enzyme required for sulfatase activity